MTSMTAFAANDTLATAKELFWRNGFEDTSVAELVEATGLNRYAIYSAYGGKLEIFLAALEAYYTERRDLFFKVFSDPKRGPIDAIRAVSEYCIKEITDRGAGCLMCNVAVEVGRRNDVVAARVNSYLQDIRNAKEMALTLAAERGELNPAITPKDGASLLLTNMLGGGVLARNGASRKELLESFNACIAILTSASSGRNALKH
ncbi:MAG: TetR/AcrR family transcriptional regulator [Pseudomonadota bacterium]